MIIHRMKSKSASVIAILSLLGGCAGWGDGFSGMAQEKARADCQANVGYTEYHDCLAKVNKSYQDWRAQKGQDEPKK